MTTPTVPPPARPHQPAARAPQPVRRGRCSYAESLGYEVVEVFRENDTSAFKTATVLPAPG